MVYTICPGLDLCWAGPQHHFYFYLLCLKPKYSGDDRDGALYKEHASFLSSTLALKTVSKVPSGWAGSAGSMSFSSDQTVSFTSASSSPEGTQAVVTHQHPLDQRWKEVIFSSQSTVKIFKFYVFAWSKSECRSELDCGVISPQKLLKHSNWAWGSIFQQVCASCYSRLPEEQS